MTGPAGSARAIDTARDALFELASRQLGVPTGQLIVQTNVSINGGDPSIQVSYGQLLQGKRFNLTVNSKTEFPKNPKDYTVLGTSVPAQLIFPLKLPGNSSTSSTCGDPGCYTERWFDLPVVGARLVTMTSKFHCRDARQCSDRRQE